jgi:hypothetical protein
MTRLDYTRTGRWRLMPAADPSAALFDDPLSAEPADSDPGFEVIELGAEKWDEIAPLFRRWSRSGD